MHRVSVSCEPRHTGWDAVATGPDCLSEPLAWSESCEVHNQQQLGFKRCELGRVHKIPSVSQLLLLNAVCL